MFAKEINMYVDYISELAIIAGDDEQEWKKLNKMRKNLEKGMDFCMEISLKDAYSDENLESIRNTVERQRIQLEEIFSVTA